MLDQMIRQTAVAQATGEGTQQTRRRRAGNRAPLCIWRLQGHAEKVAAAEPTEAELRRL